MRIEFRDRQKLEASYIAGKNLSRLGNGVFRKFVQAVNLLRVVDDETELYAFKGLRFERLSGDRAGQCSMRLNKQFRLVFRLGTDEMGRKVVIVEVVDYH